MSGLELVVAAAAIPVVVKKVRDRRAASSIELEHALAQQRIAAIRDRAIEDLLAAERRALASELGDYPTAEIATRVDGW